MLDTENDLVKEEIVEHVREQVEEIFTTTFGKDTGTSAKNFQGRLSTDPSNKCIQGLGSYDFSTMCGTLSSELQEKAAERGLMLDSCITEREDGNFHTYLIYEENGVEVLVDPTIGQFLEGHKHTFVGTRKKLHDLVVNQTGESKPYQIVNTSSRHNPEEAFQRAWGWKSRLRISAEAAVKTSRIVQSLDSANIFRK